MITKSQFLRKLDMLASRRPGTYTEDSTVSFVCSPTGMVPEVFYIFLSKSFGEAVKDLQPNDLQGGEMTMGELYDRLAGQQATA